MKQSSQHGIAVYFMAVTIVMSFCLPTVFDSGLVCLAQESKPDKITIGFHDVSSVPFLGFFMAQECGLYKRAGLPEVEFLTSKSSGDIPTGLKNGTIDMAVAWMAEGIRWRSQGCPLLALARMEQESSAAFFFRTDQGAGILNSSRPDFSKWNVAIWFSCDATPKAFFAAMKMNPRLIVQRKDETELFDLGVAEISFGTSWYNGILYNMLRYRENIRMVGFSNYEMNFPEETLFCSETFYARYPNLCRRFARATFHGWSEVYKNRPKALEILVRYAERDKTISDPVVLNAQLDAYHETLKLNDAPEQNGWCNKHNFDSLVVAMTDARLIEKEKVPVFSEFFRYVFSHKSKPANQSAVHQQILIPQTSFVQPSDVRSFPFQQTSDNYPLPGLKGNEQ